MSRFHAVHALAARAAGYFPSLVDLASGIAFLYHVGIFPRSVRNYLAVNSRKTVDEPLESLFFVHLDTCWWRSVIALTHVFRGHHAYMNERHAMRDYFKPGVSRLGFGMIGPEMEWGED